MKKFTFLFVLFFCAKMAFGQWETVYFPTTGVQLPNLNAVEFYNFNRGIAVGYEDDEVKACIIRTDDNGNTWDNVHTLMMESIYNDICFFNAYTIVVVGGIYSPNVHGVIARSNDSGDNWVVTEMPVVLNSINFVNSGLAYVSGYEGIIYKTTDYGVTWDSLNTGYSTRLESIYFVNDTVGFACGNNIILKTTNGGINWSAISQNAEFKNVFFTTDSIGFCMTRSGASDDSLYVYRTVNQGVSWDMYSSVLTSMMHSSMFFTDENIGFMVGQFSVLKTIDGGLNWTEEQAQSPGWYNFYDNVMDVSFLNKDTGFIVGYGQFYRTVTGGYNPTLAIDDSPNELNLSVYPNPSNTVLNVRFEKTTSYNLTLFSMDGRMVLNEKSNSENHILNIASLDKGIYLLKVSDNNRSKVVKVVIQ